MHRCRAVCLWGVVMVVVPGCVASPLATDSRQTRLQVESLEQRVTRLESPVGTRSSGRSLDDQRVAPPMITDASESDEQGSTRRDIQWPGLSSLKAWTKLVRGLTNIATGWVELPKRVYETSHASGPGAGFTWGVLRGVGYGFIRTAGGVYEAVTFPFPAPTEYRPVMRPAYVFMND